MSDLVDRFAAEVAGDSAVADLVALLPLGRPFNPLDLLTVAPMVMGRLAARDEQVRVLDALGQAYNRAREGLISEE